MSKIANHPRSSKEYLKSPVFRAVKEEFGTIGNDLVDTNSLEKKIVGCARGSSDRIGLVEHLSPDVRAVLDAVVADNEVVEPVLAYNAVKPLYYKKLIRTYRKELPVECTQRLVDIILSSPPTIPTPKQRKLIDVGVEEQYMQLQADCELDNAAPEGIAKFEAFKRYGALVLNEFLSVAAQLQAVQKSPRLGVELCR